ncbi:MAG: hypothetical protein ABH814_00390 [bacterium]
MNQKGQVLIYIAALLSLIFIVIAVSTSLIFVSTYRSLGLAYSGRAFYGAQSGTQEAMLDLYLDSGFTGKEFDLDGVAIETVVTPTGGGYYDFESRGVYKGKLRQIVGVFRDRITYIQLISWHENSDF